jgi:hypothetical protein
MNPLAHQISAAEKRNCLKAIDVSCCKEKKND